MCSASLPFLLIGEAISWPNSANYYIPALWFEIRARRTVASPLPTFNRLGKEGWETWHCLKKSPVPPQQRIKRGGKKLIIKKKKIREEEGWKNLLTVGNLMDLCAAGSSAVWAAPRRLDGWWESHHEAGKEPLSAEAGQASPGSPGRARLAGPG